MRIDQLLPFAAALAFLCHAHTVCATHVLEDFEGKGAVSIHSERWNAIRDIPLHKGQQVKIKAIKGLILQVEPADTPNLEESS